jgi:hypothetical protein
MKSDVGYQPNVIDEGTIDGMDPLQVSYKHSGNVNVFLDRKNKQLCIHVHFTSHHHNMLFTVKRNG